MFKKIIGWYVDRKVSGIKKNLSVESELYDQVEPALKSLMLAYIKELEFFKETGIKNTSGNFRKFYSKFKNLPYIDQMLVSELCYVDAEGTVTDDGFMLEGAIILVILSAFLLGLLFYAYYSGPIFGSSFLGYLLIVVIPFVIILGASRKLSIYPILLFFRWPKIKTLIK